jgi:DNA-directed RNA polymerase subunit K/omega
MEKVKQSRTQDVDIEKCIENAGGNRYAMILQAVQRARQLAHENKLTDHYVNPAMTALVELDSKSSK